MRIIHPLLAGLVAALTLSCEPAHKTYISVVFDVEDYISPESEGIDEIPKWLAETMTETGVTGTFFVIGEKARSLEARGRQDVIRAMASHDIGSHTNLGSIHPTVTEILETAGWEEGVSRMLENESRGFSELERIFGVPVSTLARHGGSYGPQLVAALGEMGKGYVYSPIRLPGHNATWFCNTLNFFGDYGYFDDFYYSDERFEPILDSLEKNFSRDMEGVDVVSLFAGHPTKIRAEQFWDFNFYEGANPGPDSLLPPALRPAETMATAKKNFRRLMEFLQSQDYIEFATYRELTERFSFQKEEISRKELKRIATKIVGSGEIVIDDYFSPAELFAALSASLKAFGETGELPGNLLRISPLGPMELPPVNPGFSMVSHDQLLELAGEADAFLRANGYLPDRLYVEGGPAGTGSLLALFAAAYLDISNDGNARESYAVEPFEPYPIQIEESIIPVAEGFKEWIVHRPDLDMSRIIHFTRLQLWTVKPALEQ